MDKDSTTIAKVRDTVNPDNIKKVRQQPYKEGFRQDSCQSEYFAQSSKKSES